MFIQLNINDYEDLQNITMILLNQIIKNKVHPLPLTNDNVALVISELEAELLYQESSRSLGSIFETGPIHKSRYNKDDILKTAKNLLK